MSPDEPKSRILIVTPSLIGGGAEKTLLNLLRRLDLTRRDICLLIVLPGGRLETEVPADVKKLHLFRNKRIGQVISWFFRKRIARWPMEYFWARVIKEGYDVVLFFQDCFLTSLVSTLHDNTKKYAIVHASYGTHPQYCQDFSNAIVRSRLVNERYKALDRIVFVSESAERSFVNLFGTPTDRELIPILLDKAKIIHLSNVVDDHNHGWSGIWRRHSTSRDPVFVCIANLLPVKNHALLIEAAEILRDRGLSFNIFCLGEGPLKPLIVKKITTKKLGGHVHLLGFVSNPYPMIAESDALILTSRSEAMPTVLFEAMVLNTPVIATQCDAVKEALVDGKYGVIVSPNPQALADEMEKVILSGDYRRALTTAAREWAETYDEQKVIESYESLLQ